MADGKGDLEVEARFIGPHPRYYGEQLDILDQFVELFELWFGKGEVNRDYAGLVVLNPFVSQMRIWFTVAFGPDGPQYFENAIRKLYAARRRGRSTLALKEEGPHVFLPGEFRYGGAVLHRGIPAGVSAFTEHQDDFAARGWVNLLADEMDQIFDRSQGGSKYVMPFPDDHESAFWLDLPELAVDYLHGISQPLPGIETTPYIPRGGALAGPPYNSGPSTITDRLG